MKKLLGILFIGLMVSGCATKGNDNETKLKKSPCACGEIYNSKAQNV